VRNAIEAADARLLYRPPYGPDFNPIENAFAKLKARLRQAGERSVEGLWHLIGKLLGAFSPQECANYFAAAGYDQLKTLSVTQSQRMDVGVAIEHAWVWRLADRSVATRPRT
jgi:hypothetical protein